MDNATKIILAIVALFAAPTIGLSVYNKITRNTFKIKQFGIGKTVKQDATIHNNSDKKDN